jgi:hypothetical protein
MCEGKEREGKGGGSRSGECVKRRKRIWGVAGKDEEFK